MRCPPCRARGEQPATRFLAAERRADRLALGMRSGRQDFAAVLHVLQLCWNSCSARHDGLLCVRNWTNAWRCGREGEHALSSSNISAQSALTGGVDDADALGGLGSAYLA